MNAKAALTALLTGYSALAYGQATALVVPPGVQLATDSVASRQLLTALNGFLKFKNQPDTPNPYISLQPSPADAALLDELRDLEQSRRSLSNILYSNQLLAATPLDSATYLLQIGSLGLANGAPVVHATARLLAHRTKAGFVIGSPLRATTQAWRSATVGSCMFRYQTTLDRTAAKAYAKQVAFFDRKLGVSTWQTELFCCDNLPQALQLVGIDYKADYNGVAHNSLSARGPQQLLVLYAEGPLDQFDPHDLWHQRLRNTMAPSIINKPVDEGCAYLYGGSWGIGWPAILQQFKERVRAQPGKDWLATYDTFAKFGEPKRPLLEAYVLNALLVQHIERTQGFGAVKRLLGCGKYEKDNALYFQVLEQVAGITKSNFNARMEQLIRESKS